MLTDFLKSVSVKKKTKQNWNGFSVKIDFYLFWYKTKVDYLELNHIFKAKAFGQTQMLDTYIATQIWRMRSVVN
jgi:hypothetical protein